MILVSQNIYVTGNGDTWIWPITVKNNSTISATSVVVTNTFNTGFTVDSVVASQGSYNTGTGVWTIGTMAPNSTVTLNITCTVTDINSAPFTLDSTVSSFGTETTPLDNEASGIVRSLCDSFSSCFVNETSYHLEIPGDGTPEEVQDYIESEIEAPSCGDTAIVGGNCSDTWFSVFHCGSGWTLPVLISRNTHYNNIFFVDANSYANDLTAQKGSDTCVYETIQAALNAAIDGDTVKVMPGIYELDTAIDLDGLSGMITLHVSPGAFIKGDNGSFVITDNGGFIGKLVITGGGTIQGNYTGGLISITNTDPTSKLYISNIDLVNIEGDGIISEVPTYLSNVSFYDTDISNKCIVTTGANEVQCRNVFSNVVEDVAAMVSIQAITVDAHLILNYV